MQIGLQMIFANHKDFTDAEMYKNDIRLALEADAMGLDMIAMVEHHFTDYSMVPDNAQVLSYLAAKTKQIKLMPGAFILPWNDPLRVAEKIILLDILSEGRALLGMGRGLARREFTGFRQNMSETRERFDEAAEMILQALDTGFMEGNGKYYKQPRVELRPRAFQSFRGRSLMVGMSPASVETAARLGLGCLKFSNIPWDQALTEVNEYYDSFKIHHGAEAPRITCVDFLSCFTDPKKAESYKDTYLARAWGRVMDHYEMRGEHFDVGNGSYDSYIEAAKELRGMKEEEAMNLWASANLVGTPDVILEKLKMRRVLMGDFNVLIDVRATDIPYEDAYAQLKLFADKVLPVVKSWGSSLQEPALHASS